MLLKRCWRDTAIKNNRAVRLFQLGRDALELGIQVRAKAVHDREPSPEDVDRHLNERFVIIDHEADFADDGDGVPTIDWFLETAEQAMYRHGYDILVLDPWNKIDLGGSGGNDYTLEKRALNRIKAFAKRHNVMLVIVTHPSLAIRGQGGKVREPTLLDAAGGPHWANMTDFFISVHRDDADTDDVIVCVRKAKRLADGKRGRVRLRYRHFDRWFERVADDPKPTKLKTATRRDIDDLEPEGDNLPF